MRRQMRIGRRIPDVVVDPVGYPEEAVFAHLEHTLEAMPELDGLDLACVGRADRVEQIRIDQPTLEQIHLSEEFQPFGGVFGPRQAGRGIVHHGKASLIAHVVDGEEYAGFLPRWVIPIERLEIGDGECRLPVMRVQYVWRPCGLPAGLQDRAAEEDKALQVIGIVAALLAVEASPAKEGIIAGTDERDSLVPERAGLDPDLDRVAAEGDRYRRCLAETARFGIETRIAREGQLDLVPQARQLNRQRPCHIR